MTAPQFDASIPRRQPDDLRCDNCGNRARFNVSVTHSHVRGIWARLSCSSLCGDIISRWGIAEFPAHGKTTVSVTRM